MSSQRRRIYLQDYAVMVTLAEVSGMLAGIALALEEGHFEQEPADYEFLAKTLRKSCSKLDSLCAMGCDRQHKSAGSEDAIDALYHITVVLADICERNGMNADEGEELTKQFKRLSTHIGTERNEED